MHWTGSQLSFLTLTLFCLYVAEAVAVDTPSSRGVLLAQTGAVCAEVFTWMQNSLSQSPCLVAAFVIGACASGDWNIPALIPGYGYNYPNATSANQCSCSWSAYNLLSACAVCQNGTAPNWDPYAQDCGGLDQTYFPSNITFPVETALPYWSITNPTQWTDAHFDTSKAYAIANQHHPDIKSSTIETNATPHKNNTGGIVGGVIGGLVALGIIVACLTWYMLKKRQRTGDRPPRTHPFSQPIPPQRSLSTTTFQSTTATTAAEQTGMRQVSMVQGSGEGYVSSSTAHVPSDGTHANHDESSGLLRLFGRGSRRGRSDNVEPFYGNDPDPGRTVKDRGIAMVDRPGLYTVNEAPSPPSTPFVMSVARATGGNTDPDDTGSVSHHEEGKPSINPPAYTLLPAPTPVPAARVSSLREQGYGHRHGPIRKGGSIDSTSSSATGSVTRLTVPSAIQESESGEGT